MITENIIIKNYAAVAMNTNIEGVLTRNFTSRKEIILFPSLPKRIEQVKQFFNKIKTSYRKTFFFDIQNLFSAPVR